MSGNTVQLYIYDISNGTAAAMSPMLLGKKIDGVWHTSIVVYDTEYFFGSSGIQTIQPGSTALGEPLEIINLGKTDVLRENFEIHLSCLSDSSYTPSSYDLFKHNCNNFSDEIANYLCGKGVPKYILDLPNEVLQCPLGHTFQAFVSNLEKSATTLANSFPFKENSPDLAALNSQIEEARYNSFLLEQRRKTLKEKLAKKERKKLKKRNKLLKEGKPIPPELEEITMADTEAVNGSESQLPSEQAIAMEEDEKRLEEERKRARDPPVVYKDALDIKVEFDTLVGLIDGKLNTDEQQSLEELHSYMIADEGSWALGENFLVFIGRLLNDKELPVEVRIRTLNVLALAALKDDVILLLHQDRRDHVLMNFAFDIDRHSLEEQKSLSLFLANMFENMSSSEWMLYISEWTYNNQPISNIRVTTKVAVHSLLSEDKDLQDKGSAIIHNLACKEVKTVVFDDVAVELTMALLQFFSTKPGEEYLFRCMKALSKFTEISRQEVPQLIQMIGPNPSTFKGTSSRVDELIDQIAPRLR